EREKSAVGVPRPRIARSAGPGVRYRQHGQTEGCGGFAKRQLRGGIAAIVHHNDLKPIARKIQFGQAAKALAQLRRTPVCGDDDRERQWFRDSVFLHPAADRRGAATVLTCRSRAHSSVNSRDFAPPGPHAYPIISPNALVISPMMRAGSTRASPPPPMVRRTCGATRQSLTTVINTEAAV